MKPWLLFLFLLAYSKAQTQGLPIGNEWIVPRQSYYKIPIARTARYRITHADGQRAGLPLSAINPQQLQLFWRGQEQAIRVVGEADGRFDPADYLEFQGQQNDGVPDSALYHPTSAQPHPFYSLFSDTTAYFLTWRLDGKPGKRLPESTHPSPVRSADEVQLLTTDYPAGMLYPLGAGYSNGVAMSFYDVGEGWTGPVVESGQRAEQVCRLTNVVWVDTISTTVEWLFVGRKPGLHRVLAFVGTRPAGEVSFTDYNHARLRVQFYRTDLVADSVLRVSFVPQNKDDEVSASYVRVRYELQTSPVDQPVPVPAIQPVSFRTINPSAVNYLIVTHKALRQPVAGHADCVREYAAYRASVAGGQYDTLTVNIDELFDQFNYGERSPLAIRRLATLMATGGRSPMLFLIGQSRDPQSVRKNPNAARLDQVPNAGWPGSDTELVNVSPTDVPNYRLPISRLNANRPEQVLAYLNKVKTYEAAPPALWQKRMLHLSGGRTAEELTRFRRYVDAFKSVVEGSALGTTVTTLSKQTDELVEKLPVVDLINQGVGLVSLFGHSSLDVADVDLGFASDDRQGYQNQGRYPFMLVNGCAAGNVFFGRPTYGTDWVLAPDRGAIGFLAHTHNGFGTALKDFSDQFYALLTDSLWATKPIGALHLETIRRYLTTNQTIFDRANAQQFLLQADPAIRLFRANKPDVSPESGQLTRLGRDSVQVRLVVANYGFTRQDSVSVLLRHFLSDGQWLSDRRVRIPVPVFADTVTFAFLAPAATSSIVQVSLNADYKLVESSYTNNTALYGSLANALPFPPDGLAPILDVAFDGRQIRDNDLVAPQPEISVLLLDDNPRLLRTDTTGLALYLQRSPDGLSTKYERLNLAGARWQPASPDNAFRLWYRPSAPWSDGHYALEVQGRDLSGNRAAPYRIRFRVQGEPALVEAGAWPNPSAHSVYFFMTLTGQTPPDFLTVQVTDVSGRPVRRLSQPARIGQNECYWNGTTDSGQRLPGGLYLYRIEAGAYRATGRILLD